MSETTEDSAPPVEQEAPVEQNVEQAATEGFEQQATEQTEHEEAEPKRAENPGWVKPAIDRLTREKHEARRRAEQLEQENRVLRQMTEGKLPPAAMRSDASDDEVLERKASELLARREAAAKQSELIQNGVKELGENSWNDKTEILHHLGATGNEAFMRAVMVVPDGHKVIAALADDPTKVMGLLQRSPLEMATEIGRLAADITRKPATRKMTAAPAAGAPVTGRTVGEPSLYDPNISMSEFARLWDKKQADRGRRR